MFAQVGKLSLLAGREVDASLSTELRPADEPVPTHYWDGPGIAVAQIEGEIGPGSSLVRGSDQRRAATVEGVDLLRGASGEDQAGGSGISCCACIVCTTSGAGGLTSGSSPIAVAPS